MYKTEEEEGGSDSKYRKFLISFFLSFFLIITLK